MEQCPYNDQTLFPVWYIVHLFYLLKAWQMPTQTSALRGYVLFISDVRNTQKSLNCLSACGHTRGVLKTWKNTDYRRCKKRQGQKFRIVRSEFPRLLLSGMRSHALYEFEKQSQQRGNFSLAFLTVSFQNVVESYPTLRLGYEKCVGASQRKPKGQRRES